MKSLPSATPESMPKAINLFSKLISGIAVYCAKPSKEERKKSNDNFMVALVFNSPQK
ncbi:hypothetical protein BC749_1171 [Flavobacterium araucananum]|nr:hypothetical protein BC749_1171 [Flavobacterium araucananum]